MGTRVRRDDGGWGRGIFISSRLGRPLDDDEVRQLVSRKSITAADIKTAFEVDISGELLSFNETMVHFVKCCRQFGSEFVQLDLTSVDPSSDDPPAGSRSDSITFALEATGLSALTELLREGQSFLQDLRIGIRGSWVSGNSMKGFVNVLEAGEFRNLQIFHLTFHGNDVYSKGIDIFGTDPVFWRDLKRVLCKTRLSELAVSTSDDYRGLYMGQGDEGAGICAEAIASGNLERLQAFGLKRLGIGPGGIQILAHTLSSGHLQNLQSLDLSGNEIGNHGLQFLADSLQSDLGRMLHTLGLADIGIRDEGFVFLAAVLELGKCPKLTHLYLHGNLPGEGGLIALVKAFKSGNLKDLDVVTLYNEDNSDFVVHPITLEMILNALEDRALPRVTKMHLYSKQWPIEVSVPFVEDSIKSFYLRNPYAIVSFVAEMDPNINTGHAIEKLRRSNHDRVERVKVLQGREVPGRHGKLFFCGDPRVGKTSLRVTLTIDNESWVARLKHKMSSSLLCASRPPEDQEPTRGIEVTHLESKGGEVTIALWDLAGQHEYDVLHSSFLPDSKFANGQATFFVIVCDSRDIEKAIKQLKYWLRFISSHSVKGVQDDRRRRVFVVLNLFCGQGIPDQEVSRWKQFLVRCKDDFKGYLNLREKPFVVDVTCRSKVQDFKRTLLTEAKEVLANRRMPEICLTVQDAGREWVQSRTKEVHPCPVLTWDEYRNIDAHRLVDEQKLEAAAEYLHEAGHIIVFGSVPPSSASATKVPTFQVGTLGRLRSLLTSRGESHLSQPEGGLVVVNPEWFCKEVVGNLLLPSSIVKQGEEDKVKVDQKENGASIPISTFRRTLFQVPEDRLEEVVMILSGVGICYRLEGREEEIFIPALIDRVEIPGWSEAPWKGTNDKNAWVMGFSLEVQDVLSTLLPIAVLRKLQVDLALDEDIGLQHDLEYVARKFSVSFKYKHLYVLIEYSDEDRDRIDILVKPGVTQCSRVDQTNVAEEFVTRIAEIVADCAIGVELRKRIVRPWSAAKGWMPLKKRDVEVSASSLIDRVERKGEIDTLGWEVEGEEVGVADVLSENDLSKFYQVIFEREELTKEAATRLKGECGSVNDTEEHERTLAISQSFFANLPRGGLEEENAKLFEAIVVYMERRVAQPISEVRKLQQKTLAEIVDMKQQIKNVLDKQRTWNYQIQNLERFLVGDKESSIPRFVYVTEKGSKAWWMKLNERFVDKLVLRFLCEGSGQTGAFHEVENQDGMDVNKIQDWAKKLLPWVVWTLKAAFVAAKIAGNAVLPGLGVLLGGDSEVSNIFSNLSSMTGGAAEMTKSLFEALDAVALQQSQFGESGVHVGGSCSSTSRPGTVAGIELRGDAKEVVRKILYNLNEVERRQQVGLRRVWLEDADGRGEKHVVWICDTCFQKQERRRPGSVHDLPIGN